MLTASFDGKSDAMVKIIDFIVDFNFQSWILLIVVIEKLYAGSFVKWDFKKALQLKVMASSLCPAFQTC